MNDDSAINLKLPDEVRHILDEFRQVLHDNAERPYWTPTPKKGEEDTTPAWREHVAQFKLMPIGSFYGSPAKPAWHATPTPTSANRRAKLSSTISPTYFARVNPRAYSEPTEHCRPPIVDAYLHSDSSLIQKEPGRRPPSCRAYANTGDSTCAHGWASLEAVFCESSSLTTAL